MRATAKTYTDDFRSDAVALCRRGDRSLAEVARDVGVSHWTLRGWYRADEMKRSKEKKKTTRLVSVTPPADETAEEKIKRLEREVVRLQRKTREADPTEEADQADPTDVGAKSAKAREDATDVGAKSAKAREGLARATPKCGLATISAARNPAISATSCWPTK